jgi:hypothetical protein
MMKTLFTTIAVAGGLMLAAAGTASAATWAQCDLQARQYANSYATPAGGVVAGAVAGGLLGGLISGATGGNVGTGVGIGAGVGAVGGGLTQGAKWKQLYDQYMASCLGAAPQPQPIYQPQPATFPPPGPQAGVYQALNVRACASTSCAVIGVIQPGSVVPVNACTSPAPGAGWCQVGIPAGWGFASKKYLYF